MLLANELDWCKGKGEEKVDEHIKDLWEVYQETYQNTQQPIIINKEK